MHYTEALKHSRQDPFYYRKEVLVLTVFVLSCAKQYTSDFYKMRTICGRSA